MKFETLQAFSRIESYTDAHILNKKIDLLYNDLLFSVLFEGKWYNGSNSSELTNCFTTFIYLFNNTQYIPVTC